MEDDTTGAHHVRHDAATYNEVNALITAEGEDWVPFSRRMAITNRFLDWHFEQLAEDRDRRETWAGLLEWMDRRWPEDLFPTLADSPSRDTGPRLISALRRLAEFERQESGRSSDPH